MEIPDWGKGLQKEDDPEKKEVLIQEGYKIIGRQTKYQAAGGCLRQHLTGIKNMRMKKKDEIMPDAWGKGGAGYGQIG